MHTIEERSLSPSDLYIQAALWDFEDPDATAVYGEILSREDGYLSVTEYSEWCPGGAYNERSLTAENDEILVKLTPEEFARARQRGWPNLLRPLVEAYINRAEWLTENGFDGWTMIGGQLYEDDEAPEALLREHRERALREKIRQVLSPAGEKR